MSEVNFSKDQERAWDLLQGAENIFLTGEAGSGKSFVVQKFIAGRNLKEFPVLASTGAAAVLIGGRTFHSYMGLGIMEGGPQATVARAIANKPLKRRLKKAIGVIIDEISMIDSDAFETAEEVCRVGRESTEPWGGLRVIVVGDFSQLPPVNVNGGMRKWAFRSQVWRRSKFVSVCLKKNMRSGAPDFLKVLNDVRNGVSSAQVERFLEARTDQEIEADMGTTLFPRRNQALKFNELELHKVEGELHQFPTEYLGHERYVRALKKQSPIPEVLRIKQGALVMLRKNDVKQRWVNGSTGHIREIDSEYLLVELLTGRMAKVEKAAFSYLNGEGQVVATATNFPVDLAYATTIHKAQGMTLDKVHLDLKGLWEPGHAYVALSRVKDPEGLFVARWGRESIKADSEVRDFYNSLGDPPTI